MSNIPYPVTMKKAITDPYLINEAKGKKIYVFNVACWMFMASLITLQGCNKSNHTSPENTMRLAIISQTMMGTKTFPVTNIAPFSWEIVCVLVPYQDRIAVNASQASRINMDLRRMNYFGDEGYWALLFVDKNNTTVLKISRGDDLDLMTTDQALQLKPEADFNSTASTGCANRNAASLKPMVINKQLIVTFEEKNEPLQ